MIQRFGRTYTEFNPGPPGPNTWILASAGGGSGVLPSVTIDETAAFAAEAGGLGVSRLLAGMPLAMRADGKVVAADRAVDTRFWVCGLAMRATDPAALCSFEADGLLTATDWSAITGSAGLTPGGIYFLGDGAGKLRLGPPTTGMVCQVGRALTTKQLEVEIQPPIRLS